MSGEYAGMRPLVDMQDVAAKYAGLESTVGGLGKTVGDLTQFVRNENSQIRRDMAEQHQGLRHEMSSQNQSVIASIEKLAQAAAGGNASLRSDFSAEIARISEKQGVKSGTLIALGTLGLAALGFFVTMNNRPMEGDIGDLKTITLHQTAKLETMKDDFVLRSELDRARTIRDKMDERTLAQFDRLDERLRKVEIDTARK